MIPLLEFFFFFPELFLLAVTLQNVYEMLMRAGAAAIRKQTDAVFSRLICLGDNTQQYLVAGSWYRTASEMFYVSTGVRVLMLVFVRFSWER